MLDTVNESHMANNINIIDNGTLAKADPHLTVRGRSCKSYRAEAGWVQDAEGRRSSDIGGLNGYLTTLTGGDLLLPFFGLGDMGSLEQSQDQACSC